MPPRVLCNLGMPPAKRPPNCGAAGTKLPPELPSPPLLPRPLSLLLLILPKAPGPGGGGGAPGGLPAPGIAGAPPIGGSPELPPSFLTIGADLSFVTAFFSRAPLLMSVRRAPYIYCQLSVLICLDSTLRTRFFEAPGGGLLGRVLLSPGIGGGGGGPPKPGIGGGGGGPPKPGIGGGGGGGGGGADMLGYHSALSAGLSDMPAYEKKLRRRGWC